MKKMILTLLMGLFLFVGGGLFAEDLSPPIFQDGINVEYVMINVDQATIASANVVDIHIITGLFPTELVNPVTLEGSVLCTNIGLINYADVNTTRTELRKTSTRWSVTSQNIGYINKG